MTTRADLTADQWTLLSDAPLEVLVTMYAAGSHGPISTIKESSAGARAIVEPGNRGSASGLIAEVIPVAKSKEARHDVGHPKGASIAEVVAVCIAKLEPVGGVLAQLPDDEGQMFGGWLLDIAIAVAGAAKGVTDTEKDAIAKIAAALGVPAPAL